MTPGYQKKVEIPKGLVKVQTAGIKLVSPLQADVEALTVTDEEEYAAADMLLADITRAQKEWAKRIDPILKPLQETVKSAKQALAGAQALDKEVAGPLAVMTMRVKIQMGDYQRLKLEAEQEAREAAAMAKEQAERAKEQLAAAAKGGAPKKTVQRLEAAVEAAVEDVEAAPLPERTKASNSTVRKVRKVRCVDLKKALQGIIDGVIPENIIIVSLSAHEDSVIETWPGFEGYDDVVIARK
jgi:hypothetical protein